VPVKRRTKVLFDQGIASDVWRHTLSQIPSIFGRMVYLSGTRNSNTGRYEHHGLAMSFGEEESDRALSDSHRTVFAEWLALPLEHQKADLDLHLSTLDGPRATLVESWLKLAPYKNVLPAGIRTHESKLFLADFEALLWILRNDCGVAVPDPDA